MQYDITGYEKRIPKISSIEYADVNAGGSNGYYYHHGHDLIYDKIPDYLLTDPEQLQVLTQLHSAYISDENNLGRYTSVGTRYGLYNRDWIEITYKLKNGGVIKRRYDSLSPEKFEQYMIPFLNLEEVKSRQYPHIDTADKEILAAVVFDDRISTEAKHYNSEDARKLFNALCADIRSLSVDKLYARGALSVEIQYYVPGTIKMTGQRPSGMQQKLAYSTDVSVDINKNFVHTLAALESLGYPINDKVDFEKIDSLVIYEQEDYEKEIYYDDIVYTQSSVIYPEYVTTEVSESLRKYDTLVTDRDDIYAFYELCGLGFCDSVATADFESARDVTFEFRNDRNQTVYSKTYVLIPQELPIKLQKYFAE